MKIRIQYLAVIVLAWLGLFLSSPTSVFAGQGGSTEASSNSPLPFIIGGLVVVILASGVGLVLARRKKQ